MIDITYIFVAFFDMIGDIFHELVYTYRVIMFGYDVSVFGIFIAVCIIAIVCSIFLRSAKW